MSAWSTGSRTSASRLDRSVDDGVEPDVDVSAPWARARTPVLAAREELEIAAGAAAVVRGS